MNRKMFGDGHHKAFFNKKLSVGNALNWQYQLLDHPVPFNQNRALGSADLNLRGFEHYIVDGQQFYLAQHTLRYELINYTFNWGRFMLLETFRKMPIQVYPKIYFDHARVIDSENDSTDSYANQQLYSYGAGLDIVIYVDKIFSIDYSVNKFGRKGIYLHFNLSF